MDEGHDAGGHSGVGSLAEEAAKLAGAFATWAAQQGTGFGHQVQDHAHDVAGAVRDGLGECAHRLSEHTATGASECTVCPVCRAISAVRDVSPEVKGHLTTAATSLLAAATGLAAAFVDVRRPCSHGSPDQSGPDRGDSADGEVDPTAAAGTESEGRRNASGVQRIELDE